MSLRVHGIARTKAALKRIEIQVEAASPSAVKAGGEVLASAMRSRAPRRTGALASSIGISVSSLGEGATAKVGADVDYDRFVQGGTINMASQAYGEEAGDSASSGIAAAMAAIYRAAITG